MLRIYFGSNFPMISLFVIRQVLHTYIGQKIFRVNIKIDPVYIVTYDLIVIDSSLHLTIKNTFVFVILQICMK